MRQLNDIWAQTAQVIDSLVEYPIMQAIFLTGFVRNYEELGTLATMLHMSFPPINLKAITLCLLFLQCRQLIIKLIRHLCLNIHSRDPELSYIIYMKTHAVTPAMRQRELHFLCLDKNGSEVYAAIKENMD
jgi:hypothetical protein